MYPPNGRGQRRAQPPAQPQDASYAFYNANHTPTQSPQPGGRPNGMHQPVDAFQSPSQDQQPQQGGYAKYPYDSYAPKMQQYPPPVSPHHAPNPGGYVNNGAHAQMPQQSHNGQGMHGHPMQGSNSSLSNNSMSNHSIANPPVPNQSSMQSQFYASAWEQTSPSPVYPQRPQPNARAGGRQSVPQPLPPTNFYNPNAHQPAPAAPAGAGGFSSAYAPPPPAPTGAFSVPALQSAVPLVMAGMRMAGGSGIGGGASGAPGADVAALGAQLFQQLAPGAGGYTPAAAREGVTSFMRLPKYYFAVNHSYVLRKLALLVRPWGNRTWARQRAVDPGQFGGGGSDGTTSFLPPRDDVNAPDLYIPVVSFATYVLLVGFLHGIRAQFNAELLARHLSRGGGVLMLEAAIVKLGLYLVNARATPWLDVIAYRGYKFVGVAATMAVSIVVPKLYWVTLFYFSSMMGLFLMRSHRRIVMPREAVNNPAEVARRNAFLLFLCALQYPIYWILVTY